MFNKQFQMFRLAKERVSKAIATRFWGTNRVGHDNTLDFLDFNRMFGSMFPGRSPKGPQHNKPSSWKIRYRQKRKRLNRIAFESRRKNWGK